jgi:O-antigen/teichoic acid export membrane protein
MPRALARVAFAILGVAVAALALFFLTFALIIGAVIALVLAARWWWIMRRARAAHKAAGSIDGEYTVVERDRLR